MITSGYYIQKNPEYTFFSSAHGTFSRIDHILGHKKSLNKFKSIEIISIFSDHNSMKLEINNRKRNEKKNYMETKQHATEKPMGQWGNQKGNLKKYLEKNDNETTTTQNLSDEAKAGLRGKFIVIGLP